MEEHLSHHVTRPSEDTDIALLLALPRLRHHHRRCPAQGLWDVHIAYLELRTEY
jgi:hypothetical protein